MLSNASELSQTNLVTNLLATSSPNKVLSECVHLRDSSRVPNMENANQTVRATHRLSPSYTSPLRIIMCLTYSGACNAHSLL